MENPYSTIPDVSLTAELGSLRRRTNAETHTRDTVSNGTNPCKLWLVDGEMRAARTLDALLVQDLDAC